MRSDVQFYVRLYDPDQHGVLRVVRLIAAKDEEACRSRAILETATYAGTVACCIAAGQVSGLVSDFAGFGQIPDNLVIAPLAA